MWLVGLVVAVLVSTVLAWGPEIADRVANRVAQAPPYVVDPATEALFDSLFVVDLHGDALLWDRDLHERNERGAIDLPRLEEGNIAIQCFFIVSRSPYGLSIDYTFEKSDVITLLAIAQGWPVKTWTSPFERAVLQAQRLQDLAATSGDALIVIESKQDLNAYRGARPKGGPPVAGILGVEGAHALEGNLENLDALFELGVRIIAPTHLFDNDVGGSAHGVRKGGLTELGRQMIQAMESRGILLDLAHASAQTFDDALAVSTKPVIVSHTGVLGTCDNSRNLSDAQLRAVAATGGVVGIGFWDLAVCGDQPDDIARAIRYAVDVVGVDHVALGSDFDGGVPVPFDATGLVLVAEALRESDFSDAEIAQIMGQNAVRVLEETLPD
ncbi:MAG: dipeptidase [Myxococcota bacterium]